MKTNLKSTLTLGAMATCILLLVAFTIPQDDKWVVPEKYKNMKNEYADEDEDGIGEDLYKQHCRSCHGKEGYGDGPKAEELDSDPGDFSSEEFQVQTDGALFYKTTEGRDDMPKFDKKLPDDEDRWLIINYMRTLAE